MVFFIGFGFDFIFGLKLFFGFIFGFGLKLSFGFDFIFGFGLKLFFGLFCLMLILQVLSIGSKVIADTLHSLYIFLGLGFGGLFLGCKTAFFDVLFVDKTV